MTPSCRRTHATWSSTKCPWQAPSCLGGRKLACGKSWARTSFSAASASFCWATLGNYVGCVGACGGCLAHSLLLLGAFVAAMRAAPVLDRALYDPTSLADTADPEAKHGHCCFLRFTNVMWLKQVQRQRGAEQAPFRDLLGRQRNAQCTTGDRELLHKRTVCHLNASPAGQQELAELCDTSVHLFPTRRQVGSYNFQRLRAMSAPMCRISAVNSSPVAARASEADAGQLEGTLHIKVGARVMVLKNLWQRAGVTNGACGTCWTSCTMVVAGRPSYLSRC